MIGNGWFDPRNQYPGYVDYLVKEKIVKSGSSAHKEIMAATDKCTAAISKMDVQGDGTDAGMVLIPVCEEILSTITAATMKKCVERSLYPADMAQRIVSECLRYAQVPDVRCRVAAGACRGHTLSSTRGRRQGPPRGHHSGPPRLDTVLECRWRTVRLNFVNETPLTVDGSFWTPKSRPSVGLLSSLLEKVPILLYVGDRDLMCAYTGLETMISKLEWNGGVGMVRRPV